MPKLISHVIGLIEIDAPANPIDAVEPRAESRAAHSDTLDSEILPSDAPQARILRFDAGGEQSAPHILRLDRARIERRRGDLSRLCQELELELIRVRRLMATIKRMSRE
jgi:hypothetical protein